MNRRLGNNSISFGSKMSCTGRPLRTPAANAHCADPPLEMLCKGSWGGKGLTLAFFVHLLYCCHLLALFGNFLLIDHGVFRLINNIFRY